MEPVSLIVAALIAGAAAAGQEAGKAAVSEVVKDSYHKLKTAVVARFAGRGAAQAALVAVEQQAVELGPEQVETSWRTVLDAELTTTKATEDPGVIAAAQQLMALLDAQGARTGQYVVDNRHSRGAVTGENNTVTQHYHARPN